MKGNGFDKFVSDLLENGLYDNSLKHTIRTRASIHKDLKEVRMEILKFYKFQQTIL